MFPTRQDAVSFAAKRKAGTAQAKRGTPTTAAVAALNAPPFDQPGKTDSGDGLADQYKTKQLAE